jgi:hypothetical protein
MEGNQMSPTRIRSFSDMCSSIVTILFKELNVKIRDPSAQSVHICQMMPNMLSLL